MRRYSGATDQGSTNVIKLKTDLVKRHIFTKKMKKFLITGGSGFIGTNLIQALLEDGITVLNIDRVKPKRDDHIPYWKSLDILDARTLESLVTEFDPEVIVHLAAVTDLYGKTLDYYQSNIQGTQNIIDIAEKLPSLKNVIYTSSMYVCRPGYIPRNYDDYNPHTVYGESKVQGELLVKALKNPRHKWTIIRPTSIWGPWFGMPYLDFFNIVYQGKYFDFNNTCSKTYGYIDNTVDQIRMLIDVNTHGKTYYLGDPEIQISEWANEISLLMGKGPIRKIPFFVIRTAALTGDALGLIGVKFPMTSFRLSNMTTNNILPLADIYAVAGQPKVSRREGVMRTLTWLAKHKGYVLPSRT
jgi:nucleoside-diphosphate-sugar epimerase